MVAVSDGWVAAALAVAVHAGTRSCCAAVVVVVMVVMMMRVVVVVVVMMTLRL